MNQLTTINNQPTMSSLEISELTGKPHKDVLETIRKTFKEEGINPAEFSAVYKAGNGQEQPCFNLPRRECDLVVSGYHEAYRVTIIKRWQEIKLSKANLPTIYFNELRKKALFHVDTFLIDLAYLLG